MQVTVASRISRYSLVSCLLAYCAISGGALGAAAPMFWQISTLAEFVKGEVENVTIDSDGRVTLGPQTEVVYETASPFVWSLVTAPDGSLFAGSGNEGKVFRIDQSGRSSLFFDSAELEVHALAARPGSGLYVGTSPEGKVYAVDGSGHSEVLFDPPDKYIWALAVDGDGQVFVATGDKGLIYRVPPKSPATVFYRTGATHALALTFDREGSLLAATESPGRLFRIDSSGKAFVILDSPFREIHAIRLDPSGIIYAAAIGGRPAGTDRPPDRPEIPSTPPVPSVSTEITSMAIVDPSLSSISTPPPPTRDDRRVLRGAVYRITPDGVWDIVWESRDDAPYDLVAADQGELLLATGGKGKIFRVRAQPSSVALVTRADAQQVTGFARDGRGQILYSTANPGKIFRLSSDRARSGTYQSEVRDATTVATWGTISWRGTLPTGSSIELFTRSGNTSNPDETWSRWSTAYVKSEGDPIVSPKARFLQWKAVLTARSEAPVLTSVTVAYLPRNLRPKVESITIHPPGAVFQRPFSTGELEIAGFDEVSRDGKAPSSGSAASGAQSGPSLGRRIYQKGLQTFVWKATDENDDTLQYEVRYRREGETEWNVLKRNLTDSILVWDTTSVPNGSYLVKVIASDVASNPPGTELVGERESAAFEIDNTPPAIAIKGIRREPGRTIVAFEVRDEDSAIKRVDYSLDGDRWKPIYPRDGIADSRTELFELVLPKESTSRRLIVRAIDAMNNVSTGTGEVIPVKPSARVRP